jgi:hypothetical protein
MSGIKIIGIDSVIEKLGFIPDSIKAALLAAGEQLKGKLAEYPPQVKLSRDSVYGQSFQSDRQRRWFFASLRDGSLDVPYRRGSSANSETLGKKWTTEASNDGMKVTIGNNVSYAGFVQGGEGDNVSQSKFHKAIGWKTTDDVVSEEEGMIQDFFSEFIEDEIKKYE